MDYSVFDSLFDAVFVFRDDRTIIYCNEAAASLCGVSVRRLVNKKPVFNYITFESSDLFSNEGGTLGKAEPLPLTELKYQTANGEKGKGQVTLRPFKGSNEDLWILVSRDVTLEESLHKKYQGELEQKEDVIEELRRAQAQLEDYSKNLEDMVKERTEQVREANQMLQATMNSLGQGFLVFDEQGQCLDIYTKACESVLECEPAGLEISKVLKLKEQDAVTFRSWMEVAFPETLPFESVKDLAPKYFDHSKEYRIELDYFPIRDESGRIRAIVLVATDKTSEYLANLALEKEKEYAKMVLKAVKNKKHFSNFLKGSEETISNLIANYDKDLDCDEVFRQLHTLEGEAAALSIPELKELARQSQTALEPIRKKFGENQFELRDNYLKNLKSLESALVNFKIENKGILQSLHLTEGGSVEIPYAILSQFSKALQEVETPLWLKDQFNNDIMAQPLKNSLGFLEDLAELVAEKQGKVVNVTYNCENVRLPEGKFEGLFGSLVHSIRNAVDHGLELPDDRVELGKPRSGSIQIEARREIRQERQWTVIQISDDGRGIDPLVIKEKLEEKGYDSAAISQESDQEIIQHVFDAGFSSRDEVTEFSGRGVGMDAIRNEVESLGGNVEIQSQKGVGSKLILEFPDPENSEALELSA